MNRRAFISGSAALLATSSLARATTMTTVTTTADEGPGSLRAAIEDVNIAMGGDIGFDLEPNSVISVLSPLPVIRVPVNISGGNAVLDFTDAAGRHGLTLTGGNSTARDLSVTGAVGSGLCVSGLSGTTLTNISAFGNGEEGIVIEGSADNTITNCRVYENARYGILIFAGPLAARNYVRETYVARNGRTGVCLYNVPDCAVLDCQIVNNARGAVTVDGSVSDKALGYADNLPYVQWLGKGYATGNRVGRNYLSGNILRGVLVFYAQRADVFENTITHSQDGIDILGPDDQTDPLIVPRSNRIRANVIRYNTRYGIYRKNDVLTELANNDFLGNAVNMTRVA